jgi:EmrB/QacA subfamily drug resistance transporter
VSEPSSFRTKWAPFIAVSVGTFLSTSVIRMVSLVLPTLVDDLHTDVTMVQWVVLVYSLTMAGLLLAFGRMADVWGRKRIYALGFGIFGLASFLCGLATSLPALVVFRVLQGFGGAMLVSNSMAVLTACFPDSERGRALGLNSTVTAVASLVGPSLGGFLISEFGWRSVFHFNAAYGVMGVITTLVLLPEMPRAKDEGFDLAGAVTFMIAVATLTVALNQARSLGILSPLILILVAVCALAFVGFLVASRRARYPVLDLQLLQNRQFTVANGANFISSFGLSGFSFLMPFFLQKVMPLTAAVAGAVLMAQSAVQTVAGPISGWVTDRLGAKRVTIVGLALDAVGLAWLSMLRPDSTTADVVIRLAFLGMGSGVFQTANNAAVMGSVGRKSYSTASGFLGTMRHLGTLTGTAVIGAMFSARSSVYAGGTGVLATAGGMAGGFRDGLWFIAALYVLGALLATRQIDDAR